MKKFLMLTIALFAMVFGAVGQSLDYGAMTNTAVLFANSATTSGNLLIPVTVGIVLLCSGIGFWYRFGRKAKIST